MEAQLERRNAFLKEVGQVRDFKPASERDLENWVDECARQVKKFRISRFPEQKNQSVLTS
ncbi:MAG: uncharacterized protein KVP18_001234 [Porospora cf. gigantea A]|uniref:uncharacterized protein n=1 Tax=Porospora cf. gigantea A TaxID=2853593 RepID=UPI00355AB741|nr:MAG: hypothetical protein KVP18_001234 [Porospora cf. gigantea A]